MNPIKPRGFSLVELMIALVAGLIVSIAAVAFMLASLKSNDEYVLATRLQQELRSNLDFVTRELRRAGYDEKSLDYVNMASTSTLTSPFNRVFKTDYTSDASCIIYAYDRLPGNPGVVDLSNSEIRAVRLQTVTINGSNVGVLEFAESSAGRTPSCNTGGGANYSSYPASCTASPAAGVSGWCPLSDPYLVNVTRFNVTAIPSNLSNMQLRRFDVEMFGNLVKRPEVVREVRSSVRVRADCIRSTPATNCVVAPAGT